MRSEHCSFAQLNNGRCIAPCHYTRDQETDGDCTGNNNQILDNGRECRVTLGYVSSEGKDITHDHEAGTWSTGYKPEVNKDCTWGKSSTAIKPSATADKLKAFNLKQKVMP